MDSSNTQTKENSDSPALPRSHHPSSPHETPESHPRRIQPCLLQLLTKQHMLLPSHGEASGMPLFRQRTSMHWMQSRGQKTVSKYPRSRTKPPRSTPKAPLSPYVPPSNPEKQKTTSRTYDSDPAGRDSARRPQPHRPTSHNPTRIPTPNPYVPAQ